jgi:hypothetical protein
MRRRALVLLYCPLSAPPPRFEDTAAARDVGRHLVASRCSSRYSAAPVAETEESAIMKESQAILLAGCIQAAAVTFQQTSFGRMQGDSTPDKHARAISDMAEAIYKVITEKYGT